MSGNKNGVRTARESIITSRSLADFDFLQSTLVQLHDYIDRDMSVLNKVKQELALHEEGRLCVHERKGKYTFGCTCKGENRERGITKDRNKVHLLARKMYIEDQSKILEMRIKKLTQAAETCDEICQSKRLVEKLSRFDKAGLDLCRILFTKEQNEWIDQTYTPNPYHPEDLIYSTKGGMYMRSKSEAKIGSGIETVGIPFRYDDMVRILRNQSESNDRNRKTEPYRDIYFADFKAPNLLGGITIHEHFGAFQIESYQDNSLKRMNDYHTFTVMELTGTPLKQNEFTWSFESDIRNEEALNKLIMKILLPI